MAMMGKFLFCVVDWLLSHLSFWDIGAALLGVFIFSCMLQKFTNKGPMLWPVLGIIPSMTFHRENMYNWATQALIKAGGTFHYKGVWMGGAYGIATADPSNIEYMVKTNFKNFPKGKYYRERSVDLLGDGIFNADGELWKEQRQMAKSQIHSTRFMEFSFETMQDLVHEKLLKLTEKLVKSGDCFDLQEVLLRFTLDLLKYRLGLQDHICTAALGVDPGCLALELPEVPLAKAFEEATEFSLFRFLFPPFVWTRMKLFGIGFERRLKEAIEIVHGFAWNIVIERADKLNILGSLNDQSDLLSRLMETYENSKQDENKKFSDKFFIDFRVSFILAGRDTTSVALAWFFWLVHKNPKVETKLFSEIQDILAQRKGKCQDNVKFTVEELKKMVYLQAALSESLRLYPSVPVELKQVIEDDVLPDGTILKKGARVLHSIFSMDRMESIWGKDCLEFKPERWINEEGQFVSENQFKYVVFNGGPRLCIGKKFGYMQMKMVAASIILRHSIKVVEGHNVVPKVSTTLYMKNGLMVTLKPR